LSDLFYGNTEAVFFDLDGTLVDTAPDMVNALQDLQSANGVEPVSYELGRSHVSNGAIGLLTLAFPDELITPDSPLMDDFLERYTEQLCDKSTVFEGLDELLETLDDAGIPWGVVTNKPTHLTIPIMDMLYLTDRSACTVCGDTLPTRKPDPAQLLHACTLTDVAPEDCIYVGDALRDIEAGSNAGVATVAAGYGYITVEDDARDWGADEFAGDSHELVQIVLKAVNLSPS
jgi:phosphoglycolate phosphatase